MVNEIRTKKAGLLRARVVESVSTVCVGVTLTHLYKPPICVHCHISRKVSREHWGKNVRRVPFYKPLEEYAILDGIILGNNLIIASRVYHSLDTGV